MNLSEKVPFVVIAAIRDKIPHVTMYSERPVFSPAHETLLADVIINKTAGGTFVLTGDCIEFEFRLGGHEVEIVNGDKIPKYFEKYDPSEIKMQNKPMSVMARLATATKLMILNNQLAFLLDAGHLVGDDKDTVKARTSKMFLEKRLAGETTYLHTKSGWLELRRRFPFELTTVSLTLVDARTRPTTGPGPGFN